MIEEKLPGLQKNIELASYTTFRIGGPADYFFVAKAKEDLIRAVKAAKEFKLPFFVLAGGSNLLISDKGFRGIAIQNKASRFKLMDTKISVEAGLMLRDLMPILVENELGGLEWVAGIPGTVGGAIRGNAGAFGKSMADTIDSVEILEVKSEIKIKKYRTEDCGFNYRDSIFKKRDNLIILSAEIKLEKKDKKEIQENIKRFLNYRKEKQPMNFPSAGSIFKNPEDSSAGRLIEDCGLKGKKIGQAQISEKHANFIINLGEAKAEDILKLINLAKEKVKEKFGIELEEEIQFLGF